MSEFLKNLKHETNYTFTENGGITHKTTESALLDMFAFGGSMRKRPDEDLIVMFKKAYEENPIYALKCLFFHRDVRGGNGERRFFRVIIKWLAENDPEAVIRNLENIPLMGRWDDLYSLENTKAELPAFKLMLSQISLDLDSKTPSLLAKWLKSENTSSKESRRLAEKTRQYFSLTPREYRKMLSLLRERIKIVETLMSQNRWEEIEFDKLPSRAGLIYKNAFAKHDVTKARYESFMKDKTTKVNAAVLNPVDIAEQIFSAWHPSTIEREAWDKYWSCLKDYYNGREENGIAVCDTSGSMRGRPLSAAVSMGAYIAERGKGPFKDHFITFSSTPELVEFNGTDIYDKFRRASSANWGGSTNIEAVFDLLLNTGIKNHMKPEDMPQTIYIFSDMEFNSCVCSNKRRIVVDRYGYKHVVNDLNEDGINTVIEEQIEKWKAAGYKAPRVIFWNLDARQDNIPALGDKFSYISGNSMNMIEQILSGKDGYDLMMEKLNTERYASIK